MRKGLAGWQASGILDPGDGSGHGGISVVVPRVALLTGCAPARGFDSLSFCLKGPAETQQAFGLVGSDLRWSLAVPWDGTPWRQDMDYLLATAIVVGLVVLGSLMLSKYGMRRVTVLEYERGLKYTRGRFKTILEPGQYWYLPFFTFIQRLDVRPRFVSVTGQEVLSSDGVTLRVSLAANFEIMDANVAVNKVKDFEEALYLELQLALREIIGAADIDTLLSHRDELSQKLMAITEPKAPALGLRLISVNLKDIMFPGRLKEIFAQVVNARKEGLAALERARGETAALRNLANAAKLIEGNPSLMQLRLVQAVGGASGNTLILGVPSQSMPIPVATQQRSAKELRGEQPEGPGLETGRND
jgi:regulator of protease activity HflC (stomatin/prohibitin superfamily)